MKKVIAVVLAFVIILSCVSVTAFAAGTKISETLAQMMEQTSGDQKITVHVWLYSTVDKEAARRQARKECGYIGGLPLDMTLDEVYAYKAANNRIISEQEATAATSFVEKLGIAEEDIVYLGNHPYVIAKLTKAQINKANTYAEVESIDYADAPMAEPNDTQSDSANLFEDKVKELYPFLYNYSELYYHSDNNGDVDWVLITGEEAAVFPEPLYQVIGNRVIIEEQQTAPFGFGMAVYNVAQNTVSPIYDGMLSQYDGLEEAFNEYGCGKLIGDVDGDGSISILDATVIQRCLASLRDYPDDDEIDGSFENIRYYSDFNRDGGRDILDATCIQRYLVGLPYSTGGATTKPTVSLSFEDIDNVYEHNTVTATATGKAPFTYCYTIHGIFHANSEYGDDLGEYHRSEDQFEPGDVFFTTGYCDSNITTIPTHSITYGDPFELIVTVKDANGRESSPVTVSFYNR